MKVNKPSPLAARMLRAMINYDAQLTIERGSYSIYEPDWIGSDNRNISQSLLDVKPKKRNVFAALKNGWVEIYKTEKTQWSTKDYYRITEAGKDIIAKLANDEFHPKPPEITHDQLKIFMKKWYTNTFPSFIYLPEITLEGGQIDGYGVSLWHSRNFRAVAYEMKATRADFLSELRQPEKRKAALSVSHQFFFVTPRKLASPNEIPDPCGLIEMDKTGRAHTIIDAPYRNIYPPNWGFVALLLRHAKEVYQEKLDDAGHNKSRWF